MTVSPVGSADVEPLIAQDKVAAMPVQSAVCTYQEPIIIHVEDEVLRAALSGEESKENKPLHVNYAPPSSKKLKSAITQGDVLREQFNALKAKQVNQALEKRKLELKILYLEKKLQKEN